MRPNRFTALCLLLGASAAAAQMSEPMSEEVAELARPVSEVSLGAGLVTDDNLRFGQYTGLHEKGGYGLLDMDLVRRDDATGRWLRLSGRNLGLDSRELRFEHSRQGDWGYFVDFSQTPRLTPYTANTGVHGIGSAFLHIPYPAAASPKRDVELRTMREALRAGASKHLGGGWELQLGFRNEQKNGTRIFGRGTTGATGGHEFTPEPIDYVTQQAEATLAYTGERLQLSGGYHGAFFRNENSALFISNQPGGPAALGTGAGAFSPIGLPPDNHSHQMHLAGGYTFGAATRATFKLAYNRLMQTDGFITAPSAFVGRSDLGGQVDTKQMQLGLASRPMRALSVRANFRYDDRKDRTPERFYQTFAAAALLSAANAPTSTTNGLNEPRSIRTKTGLLEGTYSLPLGLRLTAGGDWERKDRNTSDIRSVSHRLETTETTLRAELRRSLSETLNGSIGYAHAQRDGSPWLLNTTLNGANGSNLVHPLHLADRKRDKLRGVLDWAPTEPLALHFVAEEARDDYSGRTLGPRKGKAQLFSADASYTFSETWQGTAWISRSDALAEQQTCEGAGASNTGALAACPNTAADPIWNARLRMLTDAMGVGLRVKPSGVLEIAGELVHARDLNEFRQDPLAVPLVVGTPLPDVRYRRTMASLSARYALDKRSGVRLRYAFDRFVTDDPNWSAWTFTDGTTLRQDTTQRVHFIGLAYYYQFR